ncbi:gfo/Idh/MocA family oxidoreductase [Marinicauda salina]|uniref:Gfo/Idh/MocA family oxidoreductase n=1 Tax=Marinicauda salina TaxID=2135793 RepID=A0A2U2BSW8_9PROT|nr:Gfo/Idh/MocA family oxidoreductase [Marinicauda salina]PWE17097.1 gfo/Idh/MocA family oxidoreductase [Marinicauda salina]
MNEQATKLRAGVVGAGVFGGYHASKYAADPRADFVGVFDPVHDHAEALCAKHGGRAFESLHDLVEAVDVVTVASPAVFHHDAVRRALLAGRPVLVEKPVAATVEEARELVDLARETGLVLSVGHQERFVFDAMGLFGDLPKLTGLSARRMGTPSARNLDVSVTLDLMIHDIDLVLALAGGAPERVEAEMFEARAGLPDHVRTRLTFPGGMVAELEASRVAEARDRIMDLDYETGARVEVDFLARTFEITDGLKLDPDFADRPAAKDSLGANVAAFLDAVLDPKAETVAATGADGLMALETALAIDAAAGGASRI